MKPYKLQALLLGSQNWGIWRTFYRTRSQDGAMAAMSAHNRHLAATDDRGSFRLQHEGRILARWQA